MRHELTQVTLSTYIRGTNIKVTKQQNVKHYLGELPPCLQDGKPFRKHPLALTEVRIDG